jgi:hypothetical protein
MTVRHALFIAITLGLSSFACSAELPSGAILLDPDIVWDLDPEPDSSSGTRDPVFALSRDDKSIAYISKGAVWVCSFTSGPARKLADLPNTTTALLATPENRNVWADMKNVQPWANRHMLVSKLPRPPVGVHSLSWTPNQDGVVFTLSEGQPSRPWTVVYQVNFISNDGVVTPISKFERNAYDQPNHFTCFQLTRDKKHIIASNGYTPMIWIAATNKPRATCFDVLAPSSTSGQFLGIEIDTRQLVMADEDFHITKRFGVTFNAQRFVDLVWSADERYAVCREFAEHPPEPWLEPWMGFRIDLTTGAKRALDGMYRSEQWMFTGRGGESVRTGKTQVVNGGYGDGGGGTYVSLVPDGDGDQRDIFRFVRNAAEQQSVDWHKRGRYPGVWLSKDGGLFAVALPRDVGKPGFRYFLFDRDGNRWPVARIDDESQAVSPYHILAIANAGRTIVACDDSRLFSIPIGKIKNANPPADK